MRLDEVCKIERVKKNKVYPKNTILLQVSATKGETILLNKDSSAESKYVALLPKIDIDPIYLHEMIKMQMDGFLNEYKTGPNIQIETLKHIDIPIKDIKEQKIIASITNIWESYFKKVEAQITLEEELKKVMLNKMFI